MSVEQGLRIIACLTAAVWGAGAVAGQPKTNLTARELFYAAPAAGAVPAEKAKAKPVSPGKPKPPSSTQASKRREPPPKSAEPAQVTTQVQLAKSEGAEMVNASMAVETARPLGLRYSILKYATDEEFLEVDPDLVFRSGDRIRLLVQVNDPAYLYIVMRGSSGNWRVLFPSPEYDSGSNKVLPGREYTIPSRTRFVFDEQAGTEKLFFVLGRQPEEDLDKLIYELDQGAAPGTAKPQAVKTVLAMNMVDVSDDLVGKLRGQVMARDLVFEKVDDAKPAKPAAGAPQREKAVYVVNPDTSTASRLVVDVELKHR